MVPLLRFVVLAFITNYIVRNMKSEPALEIVI